MGSFFLPINPLDDSLWGGHSDVDWYEGRYFGQLKPTDIAVRSTPFIPKNRDEAWNIVASNKQAAISILGALMSWRTASIDQLQAGLSVKPVPDFSRTEPNLYGAMLMLGVLSIGFSHAERFGHEVPHVFIAPSGDDKATRAFVKQLESGAWLQHVLTRNLFKAVRRTVRHNTFVNNIALSAAHNKHVQFIGGDGWSSLKGLDNRAVTESGHSPIGRIADAIMLADNNVLAALEIQLSNGGVFGKLHDWVQFISHSPMQRRGIICVYVLAPRLFEGTYSNPQSIISQIVESQPTVLTGDPLVGERIGFARWDDWMLSYASAKNFGQYTDLFGHEQNIFDPKWAQYTPRIHNPSIISEWGYLSVQKNIQQFWGLDTHNMRFASQFAKGFYGFIGKEVAHEQSQQ